MDNTSTSRGKAATKIPESARPRAQQCDPAARRRKLTPTANWRRHGSDWLRLSPKQLPELEMIVQKNKPVWGARGDFRP